MRRHAKRGARIRLAIREVLGSAAVTTRCGKERRSSCPLNTHYKNSSEREGDTKLITWDKTILTEYIPVPGGAPGETTETHPEAYHYYSQDTDRVRVCYLLVKPTTKNGFPDTEYVYSYDNNGLEGLFVNRDYGLRQLAVFGRFVGNTFG